jgi:Putative zinc-finger
MSHLGKRLSALIDGELSGSQRERVLGHLARCESCRGEAVALRMLKRRMLALGAASASAPLTERLISLAIMGTPAGPAAGAGEWPWAARRARPGALRAGRALRSLAGTALVLLGLAVPAAFLAGGDRHDPGPSITPAVDLFAAQQAITAGEMPVHTIAASGPPAQAPAPGSRAHLAVPRSRAQSAALPPGATASGSTRRPPRCVTGRHGSPRSHGIAASPRPAPVRAPRQVVGVLAAHVSGPQGVGVLAAHVGGPRGVSWFSARCVRAH